MSDYLSADELIELTGRTRRKAQLRALARQGIPAITNADGKPLVLRAARDSIMSPKRRRKPEPNWGAISGPAQAKH